MLDSGAALTESQSSPALTNLLATFAEAGLIAPPIPDEFVRSLTSQGPWCWATRTVDPLAMYGFDRYPNEVLLGKCSDDYLGVSHGGHGANSYFLTYQLVLGRLAVMAQVRWGGVYMDASASRNDTSRLFSEIAALLDIAGPRNEEPGPRLVVLASGGGLGAVGLLPSRCADEHECAEWRQVHRCDPALAFRRAIRHRSRPRLILAWHETSEPDDLAPWGTITLWRREGGPPFTAQETALVAGLSAPLGEALRRHARPSDELGGPMEHDEPGLLLFDRDGQVVSVNDEARLWLSELPAEPGVATDHGVDIPVWMLITMFRASAIRHGAGDGTARTHVRTRRRWLVSHASCLRQSDGSIGETALVIEPAQPTAIAPIVVEAYDLSDREQQIIRLIARGAGTTEIADELFLSRHTIHDHVKTIFSKADVSSRGELDREALRRVLRAHAPRRRDPRTRVLTSRSRLDMSSAQIVIWVIAILIVAVIAWRVWGRR